MNPWRRSFLFVSMAWAAGATPAAQPKDLTFFDPLVTAATVFPDAGQRKLYEPVRAETHDGQRTYSFIARHRRGMNAQRHFHIVTVQWAPGGTWVKDAAAMQAASGVMGPNGGFVYNAAQTDDGAYDVRVGLGELLPDSVEMPDLHLSAIAHHMVRLYRLRSGPQAPNPAGALTPP